MEILEMVRCHHCGQACEHDQHQSEEKSFCCVGCKAVYEILNENNLCEYYNIEEHPGRKTVSKNEESYQHLDDPEIRKRVLEFEAVDFARVRLFVPAIHCSSCIWLLENLQRLDRGITRSEVNFPARTVIIDFHPDKVSLARIAGILTSLGYPPRITLQSGRQPILPRVDRTPLMKLALAGFCFGNVMLFSFPEYLGLSSTEQNLKELFSWLNIALSIPVLFFSASDYFRSAWKSFSQKQINIDVPIAAGLAALFLRSSYDILTGTGPGYMDSFTGLVFFLLIGKWFQNKTYESLAFDRDYKSYFPLSVQKKSPSGWKFVLVYDLAPGDEIRIRNLEVVPADCLLLDKHSFVDYSFVTGESRPVKVSMGELVYAGGRLIGQPVSMVVEKKTSQSLLTSLWNNEAFSKTTTSIYKKIIDRAARKFTWVVLGIAAITGIYWQVADASRMWLVLTSVLMVACPCALALAAPFTYGSMLRVFGKYEFYLKNADVIERLAAVDAVVFDKTGTITSGTNANMEFCGKLTRSERRAVKLLTLTSTHPLSSQIASSIDESVSGNIDDLQEIPGKGIQGKIDGVLYRVGSAGFSGAEQLDGLSGSAVFVAAENEVIGYFIVRSAVRYNMKNMISRLAKKCASLLSGDKDMDRGLMQSLFGPGATLLFNQSPHDKLAYIRDLQGKGRTVLMVGDGLNDSGALKQSDVGIAVSDDAAVFTPACDAILKGDRLDLLDKFMALARESTYILRAAFAISFLYNAIALGFAVSGNLSPLVAAVLMPLSSISVVSFSSLSVNLAAKRKLKSI